MKNKSYFQKKINKYKKRGIPCSGPDPGCEYSVFVIDEIAYIQGCKDALKWVLGQDRISARLSLSLTETLQRELEKINGRDN